MPLAVHRHSAPSSNMRPSTQRSTSMPGSYPYPYAYLYTYDTLLNNSLGMSSSTISGASSSPRRRRVRALGTLGLNDNDGGGGVGVGRRTGTRRVVSSSSQSLLTRAYGSTSTRRRCSVSDGSTAARQVLAEIEWWRVVQGQCDTEPSVVDLDVEEPEEDDQQQQQQIGSSPIIDVLDEIEDDEAPVYSPSIPPVTRIHSSHAHHAHAHAHDDFTFTPSSFGVHSRTSSSSSSDSELDIPNRIPRGIVPFPSSAMGFDLNSPTTTPGASIFPPAPPVLMMEYDRDEVLLGAGLNGLESVPISGSSAIVKAALAALFPTSSSSTPPVESTPSPPSQLLALSFSHQDTNGVGIYTPALPQTSRVRSISLPEASNPGSCGMTKHARLAAETGDSIFGVTVRNL